MNLFLQQVQVQQLFLSGILLPPPRALQVLAGQGGWEVAPTLWDLEHLGDGQWDPGDENTNEGHTEHRTIYTLFLNQSMLFFSQDPETCQVWLQASVHCLSRSGQQKPQPCSSSHPGTILRLRDKNYVYTSRKFTSSGSSVLNNNIYIPIHFYRYLN